MYDINVCRYNRNPTARTFRCCFGHICSYSLMKCSTVCGNCELDDGEYITADVLKDVEKPDEVEVIKTDQLELEQYETDSMSHSASSSPIRISPVIPIEPTLEMCSIVYFTGYLVKKCLEKFPCEHCQINLINPNKSLNDVNQILIIYKTYNFIGPTQGLKAHSNLIIKITKICLDVFEEYFNNIKSEYHILIKLDEKVKTRLNKTWPNIFNDIPSACQAHYYYIIELLLRIKIFHRCKSENAEINGKKRVQNAAKLRILQHN